MTHAQPGTKQFTFDVAKAAASTSRISFEEAWALCRLVLDFGGGPVPGKGRRAPLDKGVVRGLKKRGLIELGGDETSQRARVGSVLNLGKQPQTWTTFSSISSSERMAGVLSASDEAIEIVAGCLPRRYRASVAAVDDYDVVVAGMPESPAPPEQILAPMIGRMVSVLITREEIERGKLIYSEHLLDALGSPFGRKHFFQRLTFTIEGYDEDPRELFEIPEVTRFVTTLIDRFPWAYLLSPDLPALRLLVMCAVGGTFDRTTSQVTLDTGAFWEIGLRLAVDAYRTAEQEQMGREQRDAMLTDIERVLGVPATAVLEVIADLGVGERAMPALNEVQKAREEWFADQQTRLVEFLSETGQSLMPLIRSDIGDRELVLVTLAMKIADWLSGASRQSTVVDKAASLDLFVPAADPRTLLNKVVELIAAQLSHRSLAIGEPWLPATGYLMLLERWAVDQRAAVGDSVFADQLRRCWNETDERALAYILELPVRPLDGFRTTVDVVSEQAEFVQQAVWSAIGDDDLAAAHKRVMSAMNLAEAPHLELIASEILLSRLVRRDLTHMAEWFADDTNEESDPDLAEALRLAVGTLRTAYDHTLGLVEGLSAYEVSRLTTHSDRRLQDAVLDGYIARYKLSPVQDGFRGYHGTFGALPWWRVALDEDDVDLVMDILDEGRGSFGYEDVKEGILPLYLVTPAGDPVYAFDYDLSLFADICELMLIGRAGRVGVDFEALRGGERVRLGSVAIRVGDELAEHLLDISTRMARSRLGSDDGFQPYAAVRRAVGHFFSDPTTSWNRPAPQFLPWRQAPVWEAL